MKSLSQLELELMNADGDDDAPLTAASLAEVAFVSAAAGLADQLVSWVEIFTQPLPSSLAPVILEDTERIVRNAEDLMGLAVVKLRAAHVSWEAIGEQLGITRQSAHERYAKVERYYAETVAAGHASWVRDPAGTAAELDAWRLHHQQVKHHKGSSPTRDAQPVSQGLRRQCAHLQLMDLDVQRSNLLRDHFPTPPEVWEAMAKLSERKAELYERLAAKLTAADPKGKKTTGFFTEGAAEERRRASEARTYARAKSCPEDQ